MSQLPTSSPTTADRVWGIFDSIGTIGRQLTPIFSGDAPRAGTTAPYIGAPPANPGGTPPAAPNARSYPDWLAPAAIVGVLAVAIFWVAKE